jgi:AraC-like DNA-binding protein
MAAILGGSARDGLERSCSDGDWVRARGPVAGIELLQAWFSGRAYAKHRHATYGICVTDVGVQAFDYRGRVETSRPGQVTVLHPDETHDGRAGAEGGFGYRIVYVEPARIADAVRAIKGRPTSLPFVPEPVSHNPTLAGAVADAFGSPLEEPLAIDALVLRLAEGLLGDDQGTGTPRRLDRAALERCRAFLDSRRAVVHSAELETVAGLSRYDLARQFRALYGTSPYRYSLLRRLDFARSTLRGGMPLVQVALVAGFADQAHFTRLFGSAFGMTPARYARLLSPPSPDRSSPGGSRPAPAVTGGQ